MSSGTPRVCALPGVESDESNGSAIRIALATQALFETGAEFGFFVSAVADVFCDARADPGSCVVASICCPRSARTAPEAVFETAAEAAADEADEEGSASPEMEVSIGEFAAQTTPAPGPAWTMNPALRHDAKRSTRADTAELRTKNSPQIADSLSPRGSAHLKAHSRETSHFSPRRATRVSDTGAREANPAEQQRGHAERRAKTRRAYTHARSPNTRTPRSPQQLDKGRRRPWRHLRPGRTFAPHSPTTN